MESFTLSSRLGRLREYLSLEGDPLVTEASRAVFLSYASQDAEAAQKICEALRAAGIEVWFDQSELRGGDAWGASIRRQIKTCALFIPVISHTTHDRVEGYFRLEWKLAVDRSHLIASDQAFLLPVVIDDTKKGDERIPERFREVQWTRVPGGGAAPCHGGGRRRRCSRQSPWRSSLWVRRGIDSWSRWPSTGGRKVDRLKFGLPRADYPIYQKAGTLCEATPVI
jgi:hypothetical protein